MRGLSFFFSRELDNRKSELASVSWRSPQSEQGRTNERTNERKSEHKRGPSLIIVSSGPTRPRRVSLFLFNLHQTGGLSPVCRKGMSPPRALPDDFKIQNNNRNIQRRGKRKTTMAPLNQAPNTKEASGIWRRRNGRFASGCHHARWHLQDSIGSQANISARRGDK